MALFVKVQISYDGESLATHVANELPDAAVEDQVLLEAASVRKPFGTLGALVGARIWVVAGHVPPEAGRVGEALVAHGTHVRLAAVVDGLMAGEGPLVGARLRALVALQALPQLVVDFAVPGQARSGEFLKTFVSCTTRFHLKVHKAVQLAERLHPPQKKTKKNSI